MTELVPDRSKLLPVFRAEDKPVIAPDPSSIIGYNAALSSDQQTTPDMLSQVYRGTSVVRRAPLPASALPSSNAASNSGAITVVEQAASASQTFKAGTNILFTVNGMVTTISATATAISWVNWQGWSANPNNAVTFNSYGSTVSNYNITHAVVVPTATEPCYISSTMAGSGVYGIYSTGLGITTGIFRYYRSRHILGSVGANSAYFLGFCDIILTLLPYAADLAANFVGFRFVNGTDTNWQAYAGKDATHVTLADTGVAPDTSSHIYELVSDGTDFTFYIDGASVASISVTDTNAPATSTPMTPTAGVASQGSATSQTLSTAYVYWYSVT